MCGVCTACRCLLVPARRKAELGARARSMDMDFLLSERRLAAPQQPRPTQPRPAAGSEVPRLPKISSRTEMKIEAAQTAMKEGQAEARTAEAEALHREWRTSVAARLRTEQAACGSASGSRSLY